MRIPADADLKVLARVCWPLRHRDVTYGYLWLLESGSLTDDALARVAPLVARAAAALAQEARSRQDLGREPHAAAVRRPRGARRRLDRAAAAR